MKSKDDVEKIKMFYTPIEICICMGVCVCMNWAKDETKREGRRADMV